MLKFYSNKKLTSNGLNLPEFEEHGVLCIPKVEIHRHHRVVAVHCSWHGGGVLKLYYLTIHLKTGKKLIILEFEARILISVGMLFIIKKYNTANNC